MPQFKVTDPQSGKSLILTGDSPPSEQELTDIFAQHSHPAAPPTIPVSSPTDRPVAHTGYAAQVRANMTAPEETGRTLSTLPEVGQKYANMGGGAITGTVLGAPSAIYGAPGDVEALGRAAIAHTVNPNVSRENVLPTSSETMDKIAGPAATPEAATGRAYGSLLSPYAWGKGIDLAGKAAGFVGSHALGLTTGQGSRPIQEAYAAGKSGGTAGQTFQANATGTANPAALVDTAERAVGQLAKERSNAYIAGMAGVKADSTVLDFKPIQEALGSQRDLGMFGDKSIKPSATRVWNKIDSVVTDWQNSNPEKYHTPAGLDALKQTINDLQYDEGLTGAAKPGSPGAIIIKNVRDAISKTIKDQAPDYAKAMKDYSEASDQLAEIKSTLSLNTTASTDTALRKLTSLMRNNVNTNYGQRASLGELLDAKSGGELMPAIAGQSLKSWTPQGLARVLAGGEATAAIMHPPAIPAIAAAMAAGSPRLVGQAAYGAGALARGGKQIAGALGNATNISSAAVPAMIGTPQMLARLLAQEPANASR